MSSDKPPCPRRGNEITIAPEQVLDFELADEKAMELRRSPTMLYELCYVIASLRSFMNRRHFLRSAALSAQGISNASQVRPTADGSASPKKRRTMYFNDARHFYLYSFEPP